MLAPVISRQRNSIWNMLVEKQELKLFKNLEDILLKRRGGPNRRTPPPPVRNFSTTTSYRAMKLGTRMQVPNPNTPAKCQVHSPTKTPFTPHMCSIQGHLSRIVNVAIYPFDHFRRM